MTKISYDPRVEKAAEAMFKVDWPHDSWSRFKPNDHIWNRYMKMAIAAFIEFNNGSDNN
jgi:hypothetical protein